MQKKLKQKENEMQIVESTPSEQVEWQAFSSWVEGKRWNWRLGGLCLEFALASHIMLLILLF